MVSKVYTIAPVGFDTRLIEVEGDSSSGLPSLQIVGLGNKAIEEAKDRVKSAISNSLLDYPKKKLTINLAPAELPKDGTHYDLPIALAILCASGQIKQSELQGAVFAGELALDGSIRSIRGSLSIAEGTKDSNIKTLFLPRANASQASLIDGINIIALDSLQQLFLHLKGEIVLDPLDLSVVKTDKKDLNNDRENISFDDIYGQDQAKRALTIAAAGRHNILLAGTPGSGKTMLAKSVISILPGASDKEKLMITKMHSLAGISSEGVVLDRPFRSPHHTASRIAIIGGGAKPIPGEISLAHYGVLFLDEIPEFPRSTLEALRQPLEDKVISLSRINGRAIYPADFMLIATMNPCPCGYYGDNKRQCQCSMSQIQSYNKRISGPLLDRIDMVVNVSPVDPDKLLNHAKTNKQHNTASSAIKQALIRQKNRFGHSDKYNSQIKSSEVSKLINMDSDAESLLISAASKLNLSTRSYFRVAKVARTIADLDSSHSVKSNHIAEALQYRIHIS